MVHLNTYLAVQCHDTGIQQEQHTYSAVNTSPTICTNTSYGTITSPSIHTETHLRAIDSIRVIDTLCITKKGTIKKLWILLLEHVISSADS